MFFSFIAKLVASSNSGTQKDKDKSLPKALILNISDAALFAYFNSRFSFNMIMG
jgi:hypothetical protein